MAVDLQSSAMPKQRSETEYALFNLPPLLIRSHKLVNSNNVAIDSERLLM